MLKFEYGRSYLWLFPIYAALFISGFALCEAVGHANWGILTLPAFLAFLLLCELGSGIALDSWWRDRHLKGSWQYRAILAWHGVALVIFSILLYLLID